MFKNHAKLCMHTIGTGQNIEGQKRIFFKNRGYLELNPFRKLKKFF